MRLLHGIFLLSLGAATGCGGCDSCFGTKQPGDDVPASTPSTAVPLQQPKAIDAGPAEPAPSDGGARDDAATASVPVLTLSAVPRPSGAPMPLGAFQSCGVYDGPRCEKTCDKGNCRQECDGVECELLCRGGYCSQLCGPEAKCRMTCPGGHCVQVCTNAEGCIKECTGGDCR